MVIKGKTQKQSEDAVAGLLLKLILETTGLYILV